ncbi:MAG: hypothetical protein NZ108_09630, partial [Bacteroidia bacterium]|nr:hypothetical protein [Bacteroidia bacterium]
MQVETWTSAAEVSHRWNELIPENHCLRIEKLSIFEQSNLPDLSYLYQLILKDEKPIAALYYQLISLQGKHYQDFSIPNSFS